jgi:hypothetical protein
MKECWVDYEIPMDDQAARDDIIFRTDLLGKVHRTGKRYTGSTIHISVVTTYELAVIICLKYKATVREYVAL